MDLNSIYTLSSSSDILFGSDGESIEMTRQLAPHASRNFVFANVENYKTFLSKLNLFSIVDVFSGFNTKEDVKIEEEYTSKKAEYSSKKKLYYDQVDLTGISSKEAQELLNELNNLKLEIDSLRIILFLISQRGLALERIISHVQLIDSNLQMTRNQTSSD